jgi:putative transposase
LADPYIKQELKKMFKYIAKWKKLSIHAWHIGDDHVHLYVSIPPKYSVAYIIQVLKGKTSMWVKKKVKKIPRGTFWARGYYVSTIGGNEYQIKNYIKNQNHRPEQPKMF